MVKSRIKPWIQGLCGLIVTQMEGLWNDITTLWLVLPLRSVPIPILVVNSCTTVHEVLHPITFFFLSDAHLCGINRGSFLNYLYWFARNNIGNYDHLSGFNKGHLFISPLGRPAIKYSGCLQKCCFPRTLRGNLADFLPDPGNLRWSLT